MTKKEKKHLAEMVKMLNKRIDKGIKYLDDRFGRSKWLPRINESRLNLGDGEVCMTGQLYDEHWEGFIEELEVKVLRKDLSDFDTEREDSDGQTAHDRAYARVMNRAASYGFFLTDEETDEDTQLTYDILTRLWFARLSVMKIEAGIELTTPPPIE